MIHCLGRVGTSILFLRLYNKRAKDTGFSRKTSIQVIRRSSAMISRSWEHGSCPFSVLSCIFWPKTSAHLLKFILRNSGRKSLLITLCKRQLLALGWWSSNSGILLVAECGVWQRIRPITHAQVEIGIEWSVNQANSFKKTGRDNLATIVYSTTRANCRHFAARRAHFQLYTYLT